MFSNDDEINFKNFYDLRGAWNDDILMNVCQD
jgi:hypothetical protein